MTTTSIVLCAAIEILGMSSYKEARACKYMPTIVEHAQKAEISPELLISLIFVESSFSPRAVSSAGACGLTQVMPKYTGGIAIKKKYTCEQLKNPKTSISAGATIFKWWKKHHSGKLLHALCGYNAGFRCSYKKNKKGKIVKRPNKHGMRYAHKVLKLQAQLVKEADRVRKDRNENKESK